MTLIQKTSGYFNSFDGTRIYYETRGTGKPLIFVYGIACLMNHWHPQLSEFSRSYQTIAFDFRGHHFSEVPENKKNLSIEALAKDIICLCEHLQIDKAVFLGHSFGNAVLVESYFKKPELFAGTCLISSFFSSPFAHLISQEQTTEAMNYVKKLYNVAPSLVTMAWKMGVTNPLSVFLSGLTGGFNIHRTSRKDIEIYAQGVANIDVRVFVTLFEELLHHNSLEELSRLSVPTLVVAGAKDSLTSLSMQENIHTQIPGSEFFFMNEGSHCVQLDFPKEVNARIEKFLATINY